jgi:hypothetical protein
MHQSSLVLTIVGMCVVSVFNLAGFARAEDTLQEQRVQFYNAKASGELSGETLDQAAVELLKEELYYVQLQTERYSVDNSDNPSKECDTYPFSVNELCAPSWSAYRKDYINYIMPGFYPNPFISTETTERNAQCVPFGWNDALSPGNFSYLSRYNKDTGKVDGYFLLGYGPTRESGKDVDGDGAPDGVIIMLSSGNMDWSQPLTLFDNGREVTIRTK